METGRDPPDFSKRLNPADALDKYFGLVHSPDVRYLIGVMCDPDPHKRISLNEIIQIAKVGVFPNNNEFNITNINDEFLSDEKFARFLNGASFLAPVQIKEFKSFAATQTLYTVEVFMRGQSNYAFIKDECEIDSYEWRTEEFEYFFHLVYDLNEARFFFLNGYFNQWIFDIVDRVVSEDNFFYTLEFDDAIFREYMPNELEKMFGDLSPQIITQLNDFLFLAYASNFLKIRFFCLNTYQKVFSEHNLMQFDKTIDRIDSIRAIFLTCIYDNKLSKWYIKEAINSKFIKFKSFEEESDFYGDIIHRMYVNDNGSVNEDDELAFIYEAFDQSLIIQDMYPQYLSEDDENNSSNISLSGSYF